MGLTKALVLAQLSVLLMSCFTALAEFTVSETQAPIPPRHHGYYAHPVAAPAHPPTHGGHHHHHPKPHPPSAAPVHPPAKAPVHPPAKAPAHSPGHHHHSHPPSHSPAHSPYSHAPVHPPTHAPPAQAPAPVHPPTHPPKKPFPRSYVAVQGVVYCKSCKYAGVPTLLNATVIAGATVKLQCNNTKYPLVVKGKTDKNGYFFITAPKTITTYGAHKCKVFLVSAPTTACSKISDFHGGLNGALLRPTKPFLSEKNLSFLLYTVGPFAFESKCPK